MVGFADHPLLGLPDLYLPGHQTIENPLAPAAIEATRRSATRLGLIDERFDLRHFTLLPPQPPISIPARTCRR
jgi:hypothetical protein